MTPMTEKLVSWVTLQTQIPEVVHTWLRLEAIKANTTMGVIVQELVEAKEAKRAKPRE